MGFPFSNFYLPSCTTATVCWPVNLPIIAHSVEGEEECMCMFICVSVCVSTIQGQGTLLASYICRGNTCSNLTKELFKLPVDTKDREENIHVHICDRLCVCVYPVKRVCCYLAHTMCVCVCVFCTCVHA